MVEDTYGVDIYSKWIKYINPQFTFVNEISDVRHNNIYIVSGSGFPYYFETIEDAIEDIKINPVFDRLVVAVDSEEMSFSEKLSEMDSFIVSKNPSKSFKIIIQHFCLETWALGNRAIITRNPGTERLREYHSFFNLLENDPELLPEYPKEELNRAQFAEKYLRTVLNEKYRNLSYTKKNPKALLNHKYFDRVKSRFIETTHIRSFDSFLKAFI